MSKTIDQKVVEMRFDNRHFENNVQTSLSTLDKLKQKLKLKDAAKGLDSINDSAKKIDMSPLSNGVETVRTRFSALEVMGVTALANITNSAVNAGKRIAAAFTITPIKTGFQEYETQINAIQTIMANTSSKGTTLDQVNQALDELNHYADKTIYNFTEMTRNIGTFTAAGTDLETSVSAIQGIANLAAVSGSTSQQASTAMYQLSQALAAGTVKLMDWNSVVNAGMGGEMFQNALRETSELLGTGAEAAIKAQGSFRESLRSGWLTSEVLTETLKKFTTSGASEYVAEYTGLSKEAVDATLAAAEAQYGEADAIKQASKALAEKSGMNAEEIESALQFAKNAEDAATKVKTFSQLMDTLKEAAQSGWTQTWEIIVGDFGEAKELFTELSDLFSGIIGRSADARNSLLESALGGTGSSGGWPELEKQITDTGIAVDDFTEALKKTAEEHGHNVDEIIAKEGSLAKAFQNGSLSTSLVVETLKKFADGAGEASEATSDMTDKLENFQKLFDGVWRGDFGNGADRIKAFADAGYDYAAVQKLVNEHTAGYKLTLEDLSESQLQSIGFTEEQTASIKELAKQAEKSGTPINELIASLEKPTGRELLIDSFRNILHSLIDTLGAVKSAWSETFSLKPEQLYGAIELFHRFTEQLVISEGTADNLRRTFKGLFAVLNIFTSIAGGVIGFAFRTLCDVLEMMDTDILSVTAAVGDAISNFRDWLFENNIIAKAIYKVIEVVKACVIAVRDWIDAFLQIPEVQQAITNLKNAVADSFESVKAFFTGGVEEAKAFVESLRAIDWSSLTFDDIKHLFDTAKEAFKSYVAGFDFGFDNVKKALNGFKETVKKNLGIAGDKLMWLKDRLMEFVDYARSKIPSVIAIGMGALLIAAVAKISDAIELLLRPLKGLNDIFEAIADSCKLFGKALSKWANAKAFEARTAGIRNLAISIAILAGAVALLTQLDQKKMWSAIGGIVALMAALTALSLGMSVMGKFGTGMPKMSAALVGLSASLIILVGCLKIMEGLDTHKASRNVVLLGGMLLGLAVAAGLLGKLAPQLSKGSLTLLIMAASLGMMVKTLVELDRVNFSNLGKSLFTMAGLIVMMGLLAKVSDGIKFKSAVGLVAMVVGLKLMVSVIDDIAAIDTRNIEDNLKSFVVIFGSIGAIMLISKFAGASAAKAGFGLLAITASLLLITHVIKKLAEVNESDLAKAADAISKILLVFGAVVALSHFAGKYAVRAGAMLLMMSGALLVLTGVIHLLKDVDPSGLTRAVGAIAAISIMFGALIAVTKLAQDVKGTLIVLTVAVSLLALAIAGLSRIDPASLAAATASMSSVIGVFALLIAATKYIDSQNWVKSLVSIIGMTLVVGALAGILYALSKCEVGSTLNVAASLSVLLMSLAASCVILSKVKGISGTAYVAALGMVLVVGLLAAIIGVLASYDVRSTLDIAKSLSILLLSLSASCLILSAVGMTGPAALIGVGVLAGVIIAIGALMAAIGALVTYLPGMETFLDKGIDILEKISYSLGSIFGNLIGGLGAGLTAGLPEIGENLAAFIENAQPFFDSVGSISEESLAGVKNLAQMMLILTGANLLDSLTEFFTGKSSLTKFAEELVPFGEAMAEFSGKISGKVDEAAVTAVANAGKLLAEMATMLPNTGGVAGFFAGDNTMDVFAEGLVPFGEAMVSFSSIVAGNINDDAVLAAANAGKLMAEMATMLPNTGGVAAFFAGDNDMATFSAGLVPFGEAIVAFSSTVAGKINEESVLAAASAGKAMAELADTVPNTGGLVAFFAGDNDMAVFGNQLVLFGYAMRNYSQAIIGMDVEAVSNSATVGTALVELANTIPNCGGLVTFFTGDNDIATFGLNLVTFGTCFKAYSDAMLGVDTGVVTATTAAATSIVDLAKSLPEEGGWFSDDQTLADFGKDLSEFGAKFAEYYGTISGIDATQMAGVATEIKRLKNLMTGMVGFDDSGVSAFVTGLATLGTASIDGLISTFANSGSRISEAVSGIMTAMINAVMSNAPRVTTTFTVLMSAVIAVLTNHQQMFYSAGSALMMWLATGLANSQGYTIVAFTVTMSTCLTVISGYYNSFYTAGGYLVEGFAAGITDNTFKAEASAAAMADAAYDAAMEAMDANSPARRFITAGGYATEGFAIGIDRLGYMVKESATNMADTAVKAASHVVSRVGNVVTSGINTQPAIRPVVDMSHLRLEDIKLTSSLNTIITKPVDSMARIMTNAQSDINASNHEVITAINGLREDLNTLYNSDDQEIALYVDSKKLATSIAKPMNRQLNILSKRGAY